MGPLKVKLLHTKSSYLVLVHFIWNQIKTTLNGSIFTFTGASDVHLFLQLLCTLYDVILRLESNNLQSDGVTLQHSIGREVTLLYVLSLGSCGIISLCCFLRLRQYALMLLLIFILEIAAGILAYTRRDEVCLYGTRDPKYYIH